MYKMLLHSLYIHDKTVHILKNSVLFAGVMDISRMLNKPHIMNLSLIILKSSEDQCDVAIKHVGIGRPRF